MLTFYNEMDQQMSHIFSGVMKRDEISLWFWSSQRFFSFGETTGTSIAMYIRSDMPVINEFEKLLHDRLASAFFLSKPSSSTGRRLTAISIYSCLLIVLLESSSEIDPQQTRLRLFSTYISQIVNVAYSLFMMILKLFLYIMYRYNFHNNDVSQSCQ